MRLVIRHLTRGLIYRDVLRLLPAFPGTIFSLFWQLVNLYGSLPAVIISAVLFQLAAILMALLIMSVSLFVVDLPVAFAGGIVTVVLLILIWATVTLNLNRQTDFELFNLHYSTRTALILLGMLLCHRLPELKVSAKATFWEVHIKPTIAGNLANIKLNTIVQAISADYRKAQKLLGPDGVIFGCSPGSFARLLEEAGLDKSYYTIWDTVIPASHSRVFGHERPFCFYIVHLGNEDST